jgi:hypothetical protein
MPGSGPRLWLFAALVLSLAIVAIRHYYNRSFPSIRIVSANGRQLKGLFDGLSPTPTGGNFLKSGRAQAKLTRRASWPSWLKEFLDIFDDNVVYAAPTAAPA